MFKTTKWLFSWDQPAAASSAGSRSGSRRVNTFINEFMLQLISSKTKRVTASVSRLLIWKWLKSSSDFSKSLLSSVMIQTEKDFDVAQTNNKFYCSDRTMRRRGRDHGWFWLFSFQSKKNSQSPGRTPAGASRRAVSGLVKGCFVWVRASRRNNSRVEKHE